MAIPDASQKKYRLRSSYPAPWVLLPTPALGAEPQSHTGILGKHLPEKHCTEQKSVPYLDGHSAYHCIEGTDKSCSTQPCAVLFNLLLLKAKKKIIPTPKSISVPWHTLRSMLSVRGHLAHFRSHLLFRNLSECPTVSLTTTLNPKPGVCDQQCPLSFYLLEKEAHCSHCQLQTGRNSP